VNWPEDSFREFLKGSLKTYSIYDPLIIPKNLYMILYGMFFPPTPYERIHQINFFMKLSTAKNVEDLKKISSLRGSAGKEGFNPYLFITFDENLSAEDLEQLKMNVIPKEFPRSSIFVAPYNITRNPKTDREALEIIRHIQISAENQLAKIYPLPTGSERLKEALLFHAYIAINAYIFWMIYKKVAGTILSQKPQAPRQSQSPIQVPIIQEDSNIVPNARESPSPSPARSPNTNSNRNPEKLTKNPNANYKKDDLPALNSEVFDSVSDDEKDEGQDPKQIFTTESPPLYTSSTIEEKKDQ